MRFKTVMVLVLIAITVTGCVKMFAGYFYNRLPSYASDKLDDLFDLRDNQIRVIESRVAYHLKWHRRTQLPAYVNFLQTADKYTSDGLTATEYDRLSKKGRSLFLLMSARLRKDAAAFLTSLSPEQADYFQGETEDLNEDLVELDRKSRKEKIEEVREKYEELIEDWVGDLKPSQRLIIKGVVLKMPDMNRFRLNYRLKKQKQLIRMINSGAAESEFDTYYLSVFGDREDYVSPAYRRAFNKWQAQLKKLTLDLDKTLTKEQRAHLKEEIKGYISAIRAIRK